ncbi:MAG TPA: hypothetical protein DCZ72_02125 [Armatimonadetes bacterium]|nr:hypothetical protein [Armatimonadota bacterium]
MVSLALPLLLSVCAPADGVLVRYEATELFNIDLNDPANRVRFWEEFHLLAGLQGLVNRESAQLWLRAYQAWDDYWWDKLRAPEQWLAGREVVEESDLDALLARYADYYAGAVVYDPDLLASSNLASTVAGAERLLPIRYNPAPDSLYTRLVASGRIPVGRDLRGVASTKTEAYRWLIDNYLAPGKTNPTVLAYYLDQYWLTAQGASNQAATLPNHDFFIARGALFFDLLPWNDEAPIDDPEQTIGADHATMNEILRTAYEQNGGQMIHVGGFVPWAFKYTDWGPAGGGHPPVPTEWHYAEILSAYNAYMDADALGPCTLVNASCYQHFPLLDHYPQPPKPDDRQLRARGLLDENGVVAEGNYVSFYVGDYDSAAWLYQMFPARWDHPDRGKVPLGWAINPNLADRMAPALHYARLSASPLDWFTTGDSGAGYLNPGNLQEPRPYSGLPSGLDAWVAHNQRYLPRWDLSLVGFVIDGYARGLDADGFRAYERFAPDGIVPQKVERSGVFGKMPFVRMRADLDGPPADAAAAIAPSLRPEGWDFAVYRTILKDPGWHNEFVEALINARHDARVRVVDPYTLLALVKRYEQNKAKHVLVPWPFPEISWPSNGLEVRPVADGPYERVSVDRQIALRQRAPEGQTQYLYFRTTDRWPRPTGPLTLTVEYRDLTGRWAIHYDARDAAYAEVPGPTMTNSGEWRTATIALPAAVFDHRQNNDSDLRFVNFGGELVVRRVTLAPAEATP